MWSSLAPASSRSSSPVSPVQVSSSSASFRHVAEFALSRHRASRRSRSGRRRTSPAASVRTSDRRGGPTGGPRSRRGRAGLRAQIEPVAGALGERVEHSDAVGRTGDELDVVDGRIRAAPRRSDTTGGRPPTGLTGTRATSRRRVTPQAERQAGHSAGGRGAHGRDEGVSLPDDLLAPVAGEVRR